MRIKWLGIAGGLSIALFIVVLASAQLFPVTSAAVEPFAVDNPDFDKVIDSNARQMLGQGRQIFRFDTFGDEAFWGDVLQLHKAIEGSAHGGVGPGVSPAAGEPLRLRLFLDQSSLEVFAGDGRVSVTRILDRTASGLRIEVLGSAGGADIERLAAWPLSLRA